MNGWSSGRIHRAGRAPARRPIPSRMLTIPVVTVLLAIVAVAGATFDGGRAASAAAPEMTGLVRFGHFAPSLGTVDLYVDDADAPVAAAIEFKSATDYVTLPSGLHSFSLRVAGQAGDPLATVSANVPENGAITVGAVSTRDGIATQTYTDLLDTPEPGRALVRFINATPDAPAVDVVIVGGPTIASTVAYPNASDYEPVEPGTYDVDVVDVDDGETLLMVEGWSIAAGTQATIVIVEGTDGRIDVAPLSDAAAISLPPVGGVQTDLGQSGPASDTTRELLTAAGLAAAALAAGMLLAHRRRRRVAMR